MRILPMLLPLACAAYGGLNLLATVACLALCRSGRVRAWAQASAGASFLLRMLPSALAGGATLGLVVPGFLRYEPTASETPSLGLVALGLLGAVPLLVGSVRCLRALEASARFAAEHTRGARAVGSVGGSLPAYEIDDAYPLVAVVGLRRSRLLVARRVAAALSAEELRAVVAHEAAHVAHRDNLRQWLLRSAPDWLGLLPAARWFESAFLQAAERDADAGAARLGRGSALALASALVTVARMTPRGVRPALPASALDADALLADRVRRLAEPVAEQAPRLAGANGVPALAIGLLAWLALLPAYPVLRPEVYRSVHALLESLVAVLQ